MESCFCVHLNWNRFSYSNWIFYFWYRIYVTNWELQNWIRKMSSIFEFVSLCFNGKVRYRDGHSIKINYCRYEQHANSNPSKSTTSPRYKDINNLVEKFYFIFYFQTFCLTSPTTLQPQIFSNLFPRFIIPVPSITALLLGITGGRSSGSINRSLIKYNF